MWIINDSVKIFLKQVSTIFDQLRIRVRSCEEMSLRKLNILNDLIQAVSKRVSDQLATFLQLLKSELRCIQLSSKSIINMDLVVNLVR